MTCVVKMWKIFRSLYVWTLGILGRQSQRFKEKYMSITNEDWIDYRNNATKYLKQNSQYATCKAVQYAIDKQMGLALSVLPYFYGETYHCPSCGKYIGSNHSDLQDVNFCSNCGQKIITQW